MKIYVTRFSFTCPITRQYIYRGQCFFEIVDNDKTFFPLPKRKTFDETYAEISLIHLY